MQNEKLIKALTGEMLVIIGSTTQGDALVLVPTVYGKNTVVLARDLVNPGRALLRQFDADAHGFEGRDPIHRGNLLLGGNTLLEDVVLARKMEAEGYLVAELPKDEIEEEMLIEAGYLPYDMVGGCLTVRALGCVWARMPGEQELAA